MLTTAGHGNQPECKWPGQINGQQLLAHSKQLTGKVNKTSKGMDGG